jgi:HD superfamily phosphohydrolase YqeK
MHTTRYISFLEQVLTPHRLNHSLGVMHVMRDLADMTRPSLHDAAKDLSRAQQTAVLAEAYIPELGVDGTFLE